MSTISRDDVIEILRNKDLVVLFQDSVNQAAYEYEDLVRNNLEIMAGAGPRDRAVITNRRIIEIFESAVSPDSGVDFYDTNQTKLATVIALSKQITIGFKKLNKSMLPMRVKTIRSGRLWNNNMLLPETQELPGLDQWINITFGWKMDKFGLVTDLAIVSEQNDDTWIFVVDAAEGIVAVPEQGLLPWDDAPVFRATVKEDAKRKRSGQDDQASDQLSK